MTNSIANQVKILRKAKGVTQEEMGTALGLSYQAISKWENDATLPDIQMIPKIAEYFGISIDDVMTTGTTLEQRIEQLKSKADIVVEAVIVIVNRKAQIDESGEDRIRKKYGVEVYSIITDEDINAYMR